MSNPSSKYIELEPSTVGPMNLNFFSITLENHWCILLHCFSIIKLITMQAVLLGQLLVIKMLLLVLSLKFFISVLSVQFSSVAQLCPTLCDPMNHSMASLSITNSPSSLRLMSMSQWCHPAISSSVVPFSSCPHPSQHQSAFQWVNSSHEVAKVLEFQL